MVKTEWNIDDIALALYDYMERQPAFDDYAITLFNAECNDILFKIDSKLEQVMKFEDAEQLVALVLEYGEYKCRQYFIKGFAAGTGVQNCIESSM